MPEVIVKYKNKKTLAVLNDLAKYFGYSISAFSREVSRKQNDVNGVTIISADSSVDASDLTTIFTGKNIDAEQLRKEVWQRKK